MIGADAPVVATSGVLTISSGLIRKVREGGLTDKQLAYALSAALFVFAAWPLSLAEVPPLTDLPNHMAAVTVIQSPHLYPEFQFNGFFKTNAALFLWLYLVGQVTGIKLAAKLFALGVLAANAVVFPRLVLTLTRSRQKMLVASLFCWPMIHHWFFAMGMMDFSLGVALSLGLLLALDKQRREPSLKHALLVVGMGAASWYAHVYPLVVVHILVAVEVVRQATWRARIAAARTMVLPLAPITFLVLVSSAQHFGGGAGPIASFVDYRRFVPPWELVYNMWAAWHWSFSHLTISSLVPCIALGVLALWRRNEKVPFFSPLALFVVAALYCFLPYTLTGWYHFNSRIVPFVWMALLVRVPDRLPTWLVRALGVSAVLYTAGMAVDYVRLERDRKEFTAGIAAVPENARLLPLLFEQKGASNNTHAMLHQWGYYVIEKRTSAPLLFAHSKSFGVSHRGSAPVRFSQLFLEGFAPSAATPEKTCRSMFDGNLLVDDCNVIFKKTWGEFYDEARPRFDTILMWDAPPEARAVVPPEYRLTFQEGRLAIYARDAAAPKPAD